ncbi:hypothetical protein K432DRAFT_463240 [Lepidopterella palustris CBS 459.81]|uniref:Uncharacterized protein n=1 Tax=Lepidopterella palustris CBS 459.81 TaxID=1314670 RepID=A0A8E2EHJ8_9PEZI|nr:hypothetical protein K432DRAFT_463240 [Lepidopterella palustris CBS 459.81]
MPIRRAKTTITPTNPAAKRTGVFAANFRPPEYVDNSTLPTPRAPVDRGTYATPSLNKDLEYFHAIAAGEYKGAEPAEDPMLVLNLFRSTLTHILPIAERLTLGQAQGAPYYALNTTPSTTSHDEFNTLVVTRRNPVDAFYSDACIAEIKPKLNLTVPGTRCVAVLKRANEEYILSYGDKATLGSIGDCFGLYHKAKNVHGIEDKSAEVPLAFLYPDDGWRTLEEMADQRGIIWAKRPAWKVYEDGSVGTDHEDPRKVEGKLAYLDFQQRWPQFVSRDRNAHAIMDVLATSFFVVMTVLSRKERMIQELGSLPAYEPRRDDKGAYMY